MMDEAGWLEHAPDAVVLANTTPWIIIGHHHNYNVLYQAARTTP